MTDGALGALELEAPPQFFREQVLPGESLFLPRAGGALAPRLIELAVHPLELVFELANLGRVRVVLLAHPRLVVFLGLPFRRFPLLAADLVAHPLLLGLQGFYGALKGSRYKWLDLEALCRHLLPKDNINRIRYFTAKVSARPGDPQLPVRQQTYLRALARLPKVSVHLGVFYVATVRAYLANPPATGPRTAEIIKTEEKGSDVALATYLMLDACRRDCSTAVLITNDSDLCEPLRLARDELGLSTGVVNPHPPDRRSRALQATFFKQLRSSALAASQLAPQITDASGRKITKPTGW